MSADLTGVAAAPFKFCLEAVQWRPSGMSDQELCRIPLALKRLLSMPRTDPRVQPVLQNLASFYSGRPGFDHWAAMCERIQVELAAAGSKRRRELDDEPTGDDCRYNCARRLDDAMDDGA